MKPKEKRVSRLATFAKMMGVTVAIGAVISGGTVAMSAVSSQTHQAHAAPDVRTLLEESFDKQALTNDWEILNSSATGVPCLTASTTAQSATKYLGSCVSSVDTSHLQGQPKGYLQLTDSTPSKLAVVQNRKYLPTRDGLDVTFTQNQYVSDTAKGTKSAGDGIVVYFANTAASSGVNMTAQMNYSGTSVANISPGSTSSASAIVSNSFSVSLDVSGKGGNKAWACDDETTSVTENHIVIRDGANASLGGCLLEKVSVPTTDANAFNNLSVMPASNTSGLNGGTKVRLTMEPTANTKTPELKVYLNDQLYSTTRVKWHVLDELVIGFAAANRSNTVSTHLIRDLSVKTLNPVEPGVYAESFAHGGNGGWSRSLEVGPANNYNRVGSIISNFSGGDITYTSLSSGTSSSTMGYINDCYTFYGNSNLKSGDIIPDGTSIHCMSNGINLSSYINNMTQDAVRQQMNFKYGSSSGAQTKSWMTEIPLTYVYSPSWKVDIKDSQGNKKSPYTLPSTQMSWSGATKATRAGRCDENGNVVPVADPGNVVAGAYDGIGGTALARKSDGNLELGVTWFTVGQKAFALEKLYLYSNFMLTDLTMRTDANYPTGSNYPILGSSIRNYSFTDQEICGDVNASSAKHTTLTLNPGETTLINAYEGDGFYEFSHYNMKDELVEGGTYTFFGRGEDLDVTDNGAEDLDPTPGKIKFKVAYPNLGTISARQKSPGTGNQVDYYSSSSIPSAAVASTYNGTVSNSLKNARNNSVLTIQRKKSNGDAVESAGTYKIQRDGVPTSITVTDNGAEDLDPALGTIQYKLTGTNLANGNWTVTETAKPATEYVAAPAGTFALNSNRDNVSLVMSSPAPGELKIVSITPTDPSQEVIPGVEQQFNVTIETESFGIAFSNVKSVVGKNAELISVTGSPTLSPSLGSNSPWNFTTGNTKVTMVFKVTLTPTKR